MNYSEQKLKIEQSLSLEATPGCAVLPDRSIFLTRTAHDLKSSVTGVHYPL